jgi:hypothetical protein
MQRSEMGKKERSLRSRLTQIMHSKEFIRGTVTVREHTCGKAGCRCARGERHVSLYLSRSHRGKPQQLYIPSDMSREVKAWIKEYRDVKRLLSKISDLYWDKLKNRKG